ncbi:putative lipid II flippase FtsW [Rhodococcoides trifolii]|uniref:Probable peptidoglycan glycosyltransferase FtsW n=1 Tax=Rhodococcoides trifolii TaxID=908250 RepID=A0A917D0Y6_9NOCA|nr:putative lipid II flippase FtsW [Rhodococcus trifolii]
MRLRMDAWTNRPLASFHLVVTVAALLTTLGLVMVLSASSVEAISSDGSAYSLFTQQLIGVGLGLIAFCLVLRVPVRLLRKLSFPLFLLSIVMLVLVLIPGIGSEAQGARRWFVLGSVSFQPSEFAKVTLAMWGAHLLASRRSEGAPLKAILIPLVPAALLMCGLVVLQPNLSTAIALGIILVALLWFSGVDARLFAGIFGGGMAVATTLAFTAGYRSDRVKAFLNPGDDPQGLGYQSQQAKYSLADGGLFGRGLGQSRAKWNYLPNAHNDFIFAIIGEELGLIGCLVILGLLGLFVYTGIRIAMRSADPFLRLLTAASTTWVFGQAVINIGYVIGLLPVTGLQLPLVSYGGSSTAITLMMFGIIANAARHEPEAIAALAAGRDGKFGRLLKLPMPEPYSATRAAVARARSTRKPVPPVKPMTARTAQKAQRAQKAVGSAPRRAEPGRRGEPRSTEQRRTEPRRTETHERRPRR